MILDDITAKKRETLLKQQYAYQWEQYLRESGKLKTASFKDALQKPGLSIIGEIKKASPSRGLIRPDFDPAAIAKEYEGAVDCISVLTEEHFFQGSPDYLRLVHEMVPLPLLRKDFIISPMQILEAKLLGASCVLLITALLEPFILSEYLRFTHSIGLDAIVEVHNEEELERALDARADIIGINNRNLYDFSEDLMTTVRLRKKIPKGIVVISESSIHTMEDIKKLREVEIDAILVGESFMRTDNIRKKAADFKKAYEGSGI